MAHLQSEKTIISGLLPPHCIDANIGETTASKATNSVVYRPSYCSVDIVLEILGQLLFNLFTLLLFQTFISFS